MYQMKTALQELFFPVKESALTVNDYPIGQYFALTEDNSNRFLGIKRARQKHIINEAAFWKTTEIYELLTRSKGEAFHWWMNNEKNQFAVTVSGLRVDQFAKEFKGEILQKLEGGSIKKKSSVVRENTLDFLKPVLDSENPEFDLFSDSKLANLDLSIAFVNGYDIDHYCNLYLIVRWIDNDARIKYLAISRKSIYKDIHQIVKEFRDDLMKFIITSYNRANTPLEKKFIRPLLYNLYNKNIDSTTLQNDDEYRLKLIEFNMSTLNFTDQLTERDCNYYALTEYIIRNCYFYEGEKESLKIRNKDSVITVNETYQNSLSRLIKLYSNQNARRDFEYSNFHKLENVEYLLTV